MHITMTNSKHRRTKRIALRIAQFTAVIGTGTLLVLAAGQLAPASSAPRPVAAQETADTAGCWFEKAETLDTAELICGDVGLAPADAVDWYQMHYGDVPEKVWRYALKHGAPADPTDGCECLAVPVGTVFGPDGAVWVATYDGMEPAAE